MGSGLKAAYCNDEYLVILSSGKGDFKGNLDEIPFPPGGSSTWGTACRTRTQSAGWYSTKIPLKYTLLPSAVSTNNVAVFKANNAEHLVASDTPLRLHGAGRAPEAW
jgi:hypothetical protein